MDLLRAHLFPALQLPGAPPADAFLYAPVPTSEEAARVGQLIEGPPAVRALVFDDEVGVLEMLGREHADVLRKAMRIRGNWLGSMRRELLPGSRDRRRGTGIFMMHAQKECLRMIVERERRLGARYARIVFTRTDLRWVLPHPSLILLRPDFVWVPDTTEDDWGGLYDKHLVMPRSAADLLLGSWKLLTSGRAHSMITSVLGPQALRGNDTNTERWLAVRAVAGGLRVGRFPMTAYVSCDPGTLVQEVDARQPDHLLRSFECSAERDGRYPLEVQAVGRFVACMSEGGGETWSRAVVRRCYCAYAAPADSAGDPFPDRLELCA